MSLQLSSPPTSIGVSAVAMPRYGEPLRLKSLESQARFVSHVTQGFWASANTAGRKVCQPNKEQSVLGTCFLYQYFLEVPVFDAQPKWFGWKFWPLATSNCCFLSAGPRDCSSPWVEPQRKWFLTRTKTNTKHEPRMNISQNHHMSPRIRTGPKLKSTSHGTMVCGPPCRIYEIPNQYINPLEHFRMIQQQLISNK